MPDFQRAITRIQDADDFTGSLTDGHVPQYSTAQAKFVMSAISAGSVSVDTRSALLASSPTDPAVALSTDTLEMLLWDGAAWYVAPLELDSENTTPDMGAYNSDGLGVSDRQGYYSNVITDKILHHMVIGHNDRTETGGVRVNSGEMQVYLSGAWQAVVTGFRLFQDATSQVGELEYRPTGYANYYGVADGNGNDLGFNGLPLVQQYRASMGMYPAKIVVDGGEF